MIDQPNGQKWSNIQQRGQYPTDLPYNNGPNGLIDIKVPIKDSETNMETPSIMQSVITPRSTPIQHLAFPVSKEAVKNFREKLEKNIE